MRLDRLGLVRFAVLMCATALAGVAMSDVPDADREKELRRATQALLDAVAPGRKAVWERYLDPHVVHMDENGVVRDKAGLIKELEPLPPGLKGRIEIDTYQVTFHDDIAIAAYEVQEYLDYHDQALRSRFRSLDTWRKTPAGWRLIGQHTAAVLKDPPAISLTLKQLCEYAGVYALTDTLTTTIHCADGGLISERKDRSPVKYSAELLDAFFVPGQPRTRRIFTRDANGRVTGFVDRREGEDIRWTRDRDAPEQR